MIPELQEVLLYEREELLKRIRAKDITLDVSKYGRPYGTKFSVLVYPHLEAVGWHPSQKWTYYKPIGRPINVGMVSATSGIEALYYAREWAKANDIRVRQVLVERC